MKLNEKTGLYENYGLWHTPFWQTKKFQSVMELCGIVVVLLAAVLLLRKYLHYKRRKKLPLCDQVLLELRQLKNDQKVSVLHGKEFYLTVSTLLKNYLSQRFGYDLVSKTDTESITYLEINHADSKLTDSIKQVLQGGVIIKFANAQAAQDQIEQDYMRLITIIEQTKEKKQ